MSNLYEIINDIKTQSELVSFIRALGNDYKKNKDSWENISIDAYLEAIAAWIDDINKLSDQENKLFLNKIFNDNFYLSNINFLKTIAFILYVGKKYE
jgi:hypothetical protein